MSSKEINSIPLLNNITIHMNRYFTIFILLFGFVGNVLNILVLSQRNLRKNPCGWLFLCSSIANLSSIVFGLTTRLLSGWYIDPTETIDWICKLRTFITFASRTTAFWLITFATIDRWLSSCIDVHRRQLSTLKNAQRSTIIVALISCLIYIQMFYCYEANLLNTPLKCYGITEICRLSNDIIYASITTLLPLISMIAFGIMTTLNVRQARRRIQMVNHEVNPTSKQKEKLSGKKVDHHLLKMLLVQVILITLLTLPQAIYKLYSTITSDYAKSAYDNAMDQFLYNSALLLTFIASGMPFYIYTLCGGTVFRKALFNICKN